MCAQSDSLHGGMAAVVRKGEVSEGYVSFLKLHARNIGARLPRPYLVPRKQQRLNDSTPGDSVLNPGVAAARPSGREGFPELFL